MMTFALDALIQDPKTKVIALTSKPPAEEIADKILKQAAASGKPVVVCFVGGDPEQVKKYGLIPALSLEDAARKGGRPLQGRAVVDFTGFSAPDAEIDADRQGGDRQVRSHAEVRPQASTPAAPSATRR